MKKTISLASLFLLFAFLFVIFSPGTTAFASIYEPVGSQPSSFRPGDYIPGQLIVGMKEPISLSPSGPYALFPELDIISVKDLKAIGYPLLNKANCQFLHFT